MSSLLRTTAAAAAIAAIGVGLAGPAFAAPELPADQGTDEVGSAPATPDLASAPATAPTGVSTLPAAFAFESPHLGTADVSTPSTDLDSTGTQTDVGALQALDTARSMAGLVQRAASSGSTEQGTQIG